MVSESLAQFDIAPFLRDLANNIVAASGSSDVGVTVDAASQMVNFDMAIPLGLLVAELMTNALKHAFPSRKGQISILLAQADEGVMTLTVSDNGTGAEGAEPSSFARKGSLGMTIIKGLGAQLGATMTVSRTSGTQYRFLIPTPMPT